MQTLPTLTTKQTEILKLLYTYRFLTRPQLQKLLNHKDKRRIISWLKDLRDNQFIDWKYNAKGAIQATIRLNQHPDPALDQVGRG